VNEPWGISAMQFLLLYLIVLGGCLAGAFYTLAKVRSSSARMSTGAPTLEVYDTAYLAGGPNRVIDTAVAGLADIGRIRVGPGGQLTWVGQLARQPVELAVSERVHQGVGRLSDLRRALRHHPALTEIGRGLSSRGLIADDSKVSLAQLAAWSLAAPFALGVIRFGAELVDGGRLNGLLALLLIANGLVLAWFVRSQQFRTWYGQSLLRRLEQTTPPTRYPGIGYQLRDPLALAGAATVALFGFAGIYDRRLRETLQLSRGS
jgi:uncharacterized protein (TIGR04222 family)